jgi:hypothetical protein
MTWFIIQCERKTWTKYLVEANNEALALEAHDDWEYLGYVDDEDKESVVVGVFASKAEVMRDVASYVQS